MNIDELSETADQASDLLRIMSNQKRLLILCKLVEGEKSVSQLQDETGLGQSTVSQQLALAVIETLYSVYCAKES